MEHEGHIHAELMAQYAEDARTHKEPWKLWEFKCEGGWWTVCSNHPYWGAATDFRRKPKTHFVHGVEIPDLRIKPEYGDNYYMANTSSFGLSSLHTFFGDKADKICVKRGLTYQNTEEGRQAAILHSKAMLGIV